MMSVFEQWKEYECVAKSQSSFSISPLAPLPAECHYPQPDTTTTTAPVITEEASIQHDFDPLATYPASVQMNDIIRRASMECGIKDVREDLNQKIRTTRKRSGGEEEEDSGEYNAKRKYSGGGGEEEDSGEYNVEIDPFDIRELSIMPTLELYRAEQKRKYNREAAARFRQKNKIKTAALITETSELKLRNSQLANQLRAVTERLNYMRNLLEAHAKVCPMTIYIDSPSSNTTTTTTIKSDRVDEITSSSSSSP